jgi:hypothetical protein
MVAIDYHYGNSRDGTLPVDLLVAINVRNIITPHGSTKRPWIQAMQSYESADVSSFSGTSTMPSRHLVPRLSIDAFAYFPTTLDLESC